MNKPRRSLIVFLVWFILVSHQIVSVVCETGQYIAEEEEKSSFHHVVSNTFSSLKRTHQASWEKLKTIIHVVQTKFTPPPPTLDSRAPGSGVSESAGDRMEEAAKKSVETSQATAEGTAKSVSESAGDKMKEAAKKSVETSQATAEGTAKPVSESAGDRMKEAVKKSVETSQATDEGSAKSVSESAGDRMKEAAKKNVETSQATDEGSAKSAAGAVHQTAEKLKESVSDNKEEPRNEL